MTNNASLKVLEWHYIFNICNDPMFLLDRYYNIIECNIKAVQVYGYSRLEFLEMNMNDVRAPYSRNEIENAFNKDLVYGRNFFETRHRKKDGEEFYVELSTTSFSAEDEVLYVQVVRDITGHKLAEEALRASEKQYRDLIDFAPMAIFLQRDNRILYINPAGLKMLGAQAEEQIFGRSVFEFIHPAYHKIAAYRINLLREGMGIPVIEEKIVRLDGSVIDAEVTAKPVKFGDSPAIEVFMHDITIRKRSELQSSYLASIVESSQHSIIVCTTDGRVTYWNTAAESLFGYKNAEILQKHLWDIVSYEDHHNLISLTERVIHGENIDNYAVRFIKKSWEQISVYITLAPIIDHDSKVTGISVILFKNRH